jgi:hypothetical protein
VVLKIVATFLSAFSEIYSRFVFKSLNGQVQQAFLGDAQAKLEEKINFKKIKFCKK